MLRVYPACSILIGEGVSFLFAGEVGAGNKKNKYNRVGPVKRLPPGFTCITFIHLQSPFLPAIMDAILTYALIIIMFHIHPLFLYPA